jgi:uncharacterized membrane protein SirB2
MLKVIIMIPLLSNLPKEHIKQFKRYLQEIILYCRYILVITKIYHTKEQAYYFNSNSLILLTYVPFNEITFNSSKQTSKAIVLLNILTALIITFIMKKENLGILLRYNDDSFR